MSEALQLVVQSRRLDEEPQNARRIKENIENYILNAIYNAEVIKKAEATPQDIHEAFERHAANLMRLESVTVQTMILPDSEAAERMAARARTAPSLRSTILLASPNLQVQETVVRFPNSDSVWKDMEPELRQMPEGSIGLPRAVGSHWLVFQLVSKHLFEPTLESLTSDTQDAVRAEALQHARERRLIEYTDSLRKTIPVREYRDRLRSVPWPGPNLTLPPGLRS